MLIKNEAVDFLKKYENKILEQIEYISKKSGESFEITKKRIYNEFINFEITNHKKIICYKGKTYDVSSLVDSIKDQEIESLLCFVLKDDRFVLLQRKDGNQFTSSLSPIESIKFNCKIVSAHSPFFIVHNHPFVCKATISGADSKTFENLFDLSTEFNMDLLDFAVVTKFDYISGLKYVSENKNLSS